MSTRALKLNKLETPTMFWGLILGMILFAGLYAFMINQTVWNVVGRQKAENNISVLSSKTGQLESNYMALKSSIDLNLAHSLGFNNTANTKYINRTTLGRLSSNTVE